MIPENAIIKSVLMIELFQSKGHCVKPSKLYDRMQEYFEELLTWKDLGRYQNSKSRFANSIQVIRNHLVGENIIYKTKDHIRDEWKLTPEGINLAKQCYLRYCKKHNQNIENWES